MKRKKDLTKKAEKKELRGYYYAGVHQYEGECDEDRFIDIVCCDQYGVHYESSYDGWDSIIEEVPSYDEWRAELASNNELLTVQKRLEKKLAIATKALKKYAKTETHDWIDSQIVAQKALQEMEGVK